MQVCTKITNGEHYTSEEDCSCSLLYSSMKNPQVSLDFTIFLHRLQPFLFQIIVSIQRFVLKIVLIISLQMSTKKSFISSWQSFSNSVDFKET